MVWKAPQHKTSQAARHFLRATGCAVVAAVLAIGQPVAAQFPPAAAPRHGDAYDVPAYDVSNQYDRDPSASLPDTSPVYQMPPPEYPPAYTQYEDEAWYLHWMPDGLIYHSYMAGVKEPRCASVWSERKELTSGWDVALGGRLGLLRYGTTEADRPEGWQLDFAAAVFARLDPGGKSTPLLATDYRVDIPITYARGPWHFKLGYYHISSHVGDEYMQRVQAYKRLNYHRDALAIGVGYYCTDNLRVYSELGYAPEHGGGAEPLEIQFGADFSPTHTGFRGSPFWAVNGHLREEVDFGGNFVAQAGWQWRRTARGGMFRLGLQYYTGKSEQYEFYDRSESRLGYGLWIDY